MSSALFCPLLSYSLSSVSLRDFFGVAHLITVAGQATSSYRNVLLLFFLVMAKLERVQFYAWLIESVVTELSHVIQLRAEGPKAPSPGHRPGLGASALYLSLRPVTVGSGRVELTCDPLFHAIVF